MEDGGVDWVNGGGGEEGRGKKEVCQLIAEWVKEMVDGRQINVNIKVNINIFMSNDIEIGIDISRAAGK
ncbi:uncharacterized protein MONOS_17895 [Monocercomonoides exilis]|uniref:uncharacterized protein n=1 Tax=Monocercomonoides exilis TaxID=2049356 RepID=UPI003559D623|nr:hypothetical protein MONOS_17895 [Monocercomonoides exilis]